MQKKSPSWILLHLFIIFLTLGSLLTGFRIATLTHPEIMFFSALLPQGYLHGTHLLLAFGLVAVVVAYVVYWYFFVAKEPRTYSFHRFTIWFGYGAVLVALFSGIVLYFNLFSWVGVVDMHYYGALALLVYFLLHVGYHFTKYGRKIFKKILIPNELFNKQLFIILSILGTLFFTLYFTFGTDSHERLTLKTISSKIHIELDGKANEKEWKDTKSITLWSFGGANFEDGATPIEVKAFKNEQEAFFFIRWKDATKSLKHLPLLKTKEGWRVIENGFYKFDEVDHYEDKLAVMLSTDCSIGASKTIHLGGKPLKDKPANWHGKGYHYSHDGQIHDLWQWKAVRTNDMFVADDDYIGMPDIVRSGSRRYTAGYLLDAKTSGSYVMNWKWYKPNGIVPKRLPKNSEPLDANRSSWVVQWYDYDLYSKENDNYPVGTVMPSVIYASNTFEGDRANVRARGVWKDGWWSLELARPLDTGSKYDVPIKDGVCMWVSAFDHAQIAHTRHTRAIELNFEKDLK